MRKFLPTFLLLLFSLTTIAQNDTQQKIDSLRKVIAKQHGIEKVKTYNLLGSYLFRCASLEEMIAYFDDCEKVILQEKKNEKEKKSLPEYNSEYALMKYNYANTLFNYGAFEEVEKQIRIAIAFCRENDEWVNFYKHYGLLIETLAVLEKYELMQQEGKKIYAEAKEKNEPFGMMVTASALAKVYTIQYRFPEAEKYYRESVDLASKMDFENVIKVWLENQMQLVLVLMLQQKYDEAWQELQKAELLLQKREESGAKKGYSYPISRSNLYYLFVDFYLKTKNYDKAEYHFNLLKEFFQSLGIDDSSLDDGYYFLLKCAILEHKKQYAKALEVVEKACFLILETSPAQMELNDALLLKARLLIRMGRGEESIALFDTILANAYRFRDVEFNSQLDELRTIYEVDKITAEKERHRNYFLFALGGCVLLAIALGIWIYHSRTIVRKNRGLFSQIKAQDRLENELEAERRKNLELHLLLKPEAVVLEENEENLDLFFGKLTILMKEQRLFIDSEIKRKDVALQIGISDRGLHDCIKNSTGMSFTEYINTLRLAYSRELLTNMDEKFTIDAIAYESGFNSRTTFYRLFNEKYGLSPKQFREVSK